MSPSWPHVRCGLAKDGDEIAPGFKPPAAARGYTRIVVPVIKDIAPGGDVTR